MEAALLDLEPVRGENRIYFIPHIGPAPELCTLLDARFSATEPILRAIDAVEAEEAGGQAYMDALLYVLGVVKDPRSIPWLLENWEDLASASRDAWLRCWGGGTEKVWFMRVPTFGEHHWLTGRAEWLEFFGRLYANAPDGRSREQCLTIAIAWLVQEGRRASWIEALRGDPKLAAEEVLLVEYYFLRSFLPMDETAIKGACEDLVSRDPGRLVGYAQLLRSEHLVPYLVRLTERRVVERREVQRALGLITLRSEPQEGWAAWWSNGGGERSQWVGDYCDALLRLCSEDPIAARERLGKDKYWLDGDVHLIDEMYRLLACPEFDDDVCILAKFLWYPAANERLRRVADRLRQTRGLDHLSSVARESLEDAGLIDVDRNWASDRNTRSGP